MIITIYILQSIMQECEFNASMANLSLQNEFKMVDNNMENNKLHNKKIREHICISPPRVELGDSKD